MLHLLGLMQLYRTFERNTHLTKEGPTTLKMPEGVPEKFSSTVIVPTLAGFPKSINGQLQQDNTGRCFQSLIGSHEAIPETWGPESAVLRHKVLTWSPHAPLTLLLHHSYHGDWNTCSSKEQERNQGMYVTLLQEATPHRQESPTLAC